MEHKVDYKKLLLCLCPVVLLLIIYISSIWKLNKNTAYKVDYNYGEGYRIQYDGDFYYACGAAGMLSPQVLLSACTTVKDEVLGEDIDICLTIEKNVLGKQKMYLALYCDTNIQIADTVFLDERYDCFVEETGNIEHEKMLQSLCERNRITIDKLIQKADEIWNIQ